MGEQEKLINEPAPPAEPPVSAKEDTSSLTTEQFLVTMTIGFALAALLFFSSQLYSIGMDIRQALWTQPHMYDDLEAATQNGSAVLADARKLAIKDRQEHKSSQPASTHNKPLPGIFDSPVTFANVIQRTRDLVPYYGYITRAWVNTYDKLDKENDNVQRQLDYPPMRLYVLTLWVWHVHGQYPNLDDWPEQPKTYYDESLQKNVTATSEILQPMLLLNTCAEVTSTVAIFFLVWIWVQRGKSIGEDWRGRWGDPMLLTPVVLLGICALLRLVLTWTPTFTNGDPTPPIDDSVVSAGFWIFLTLEFLSVVCLAWFLPHPFRGPACGIVAATMVWINPTLMMDSHLWVQWDSWLPPFFLVAALLVTLDWWLCAGLVLGVACMFKGQILFVAPVLIFSPLIAGWPGRFLRIATGLLLGAGLIVSPWLMNDPEAKFYLLRILAAGMIGCVVAIGGKIIWRQRETLATGKPPQRPETPLSPKEKPVWKRNAFWRSFLLSALVADLAVAAAVVLWLLLSVWGRESAMARVWTITLAVVILAGPWLTQRRSILPWLAGIFTAGIWFCGFALNGKFSWWDIGFAYGTKRHPQMQLGYMSLSNLSSILERRWNWQLHDPVGTLHLPFLDAIKMDLQGTTALIYFITVALCTIGAAVHLRRKDPRFLIAITAPWLLFLTLLTQMAARYTLLPAVIAASLIGVSAGMSMFQLLIAVIGCIMLGNQYITSGHMLAPIAMNFTQATFPDFGWIMLLASAMMLYLAIAPGPRRRSIVEDI